MYYIFNIHFFPADSLSTSQLNSETSVAHYMNPRQLPTDCLWNKRSFIMCKILIIIASKNIKIILTITLCKYRLGAWSRMAAASPRPHCGKVTFITRGTLKCKSTTINTHPCESSGHAVLLVWRRRMCYGNILIRCICMKALSTSIEPHLLSEII